MQESRSETPGIAAIASPSTEVDPGPAGPRQDPSRNVLGERVFGNEDGLGLLDTLLGEQRQGEESGLGREIAGSDGRKQLLVSVAQLALGRLRLSCEQLDEPGHLGQPDEGHALPQVEVDLLASPVECACLVEAALHRLQPGERGGHVGL